MSYYEVHITFIGPLNETPPRPWKYSQIDGDPVLGEGIKAYLTRQYKGGTEKMLMINDIEITSVWLKRIGHTILREKIEDVIFDTKIIPESFFMEDEKVRKFNGSHL
tara:strand:+ start:136 stop:456 length:321 start_codon:yes stop_codon:yes gene_type:complete